MATYQQGINGAFTGKVGTVIGSSWNGIPYMKSLPKARTKPVHAGEKANRNKFGMAHRWLQPLLEVVRQGFKGHSPTVEGFNAAKSHTLKNAFTGEGADLQIDPALVKVSAGSLPLPNDINAEKIAANQVRFSWDPAALNDGSNYDQAVLVAYNVEDKKVKCHLTGQFRYTGSDVLNFDLTKHSGNYHLYIAFIADDRSRQSDSVYLGTMEIGESGEALVPPGEDRHTSQLPQEESVSGGQSEEVAIEEKPDQEDTVPASKSTRPAKDALLNTPRNTALANVGLWNVKLQPTMKTSLYHWLPDKPPYLCIEGNRSCISTQLTGNALSSETIGEHLTGNNYETLLPFGQSYNSSFPKENLTLQPFYIT